MEESDTIFLVCVGTQSDLTYKGLKSSKESYPVDKQDILTNKAVTHTVTATANYQKEPNTGELSNQIHPTDHGEDVDDEDMEYEILVCTGSQTDLRYKGFVSTAEQTNRESIGVSGETIKEPPIVTNNLKSETEYSKPAEMEEEIIDSELLSNDTDTRLVCVGTQTIGKIIVEEPVIHSEPEFVRKEQRTSNGVIEVNCSSPDAIEAVCSSAVEDQRITDDLPGSTADKNEQSKTASHSSVHSLDGKEPVNSTEIKEDYGSTTDKNDQSKTGSHSSVHSQDGKEAITSADVNENDRSPADKNEQLKTASHSSVHSQDEKEPVNSTEVKEKYCYFWNEDLHMLTISPSDVDKIDSARSISKCVKSEHSNSEKVCAVYWVTQTKCKRKC